MSCKKYMKKQWCRYCSKTGYLYEFDLYLGKKEKTELGLGETVVLDLSKINTHCMLYFDDFFNLPTLVKKLFNTGIYTALVQFEVTGKR